MISIKRAIVSVVISVLILAMAFAVILISGYLDYEKEIKVPEAIPMAGGAIISWPLVAFPSVFVNSQRASSPDSPTIEAFALMLVFDSLVYSLLSYTVLSWFSYRKTIQ